MTDFIILGSKSAIANTHFFPYIVKGMVVVGIEQPSNFEQGRTAPCLWYNTLGVTKKNLSLTERYSPSKHPKYDDFNAINCDRVKDIPFDFYGLIGVPLTYLCRQDERFRIVGLLQGEFAPLTEYVIGHQQKVNGQYKYTRVIIKRKI